VIKEAINKEKKEKPLNNLFVSLPQLKAALKTFVLN
jgi:hypothetical protein